MRVKPSEIVAAAIILVFIFVVVGAGLYPSLRAAPRDQCLANLKSVATAVSLYAGDNYGHMAPAERWVDALSDAFVTDWRVFICPEARPTTEEALALQAVDGRPLPVGYALFQPLAGRDVTRLEDPENTPWLYDAAPVQRNAVAGINAFAPRHYGDVGNVYFADGSAKSLAELSPVPSPLFTPARDDADEDHVHTDECDHDHDEPAHDHDHGHVHGPWCDH